MSDRPTTRQLEYLVALADLLNFGRAAEACFVTQPTLSTQIKQLEASLGVQLFERDTRHVFATPAGAALAEGEASDEARHGGRGGPVALEKLRVRRAQDTCGAQSPRKAQPQTNNTTTQTHQ